LGLSAGVKISQIQTKTRIHDSQSMSVERKRSEADENRMSWRGE